MGYMKGNNVVIMDNVLIGDNVIIDDGVYIDYGVIIRNNVHIKKGTFIGARCILGEYLKDFFTNRINGNYPLTIGENSLIRSETIIYGNNDIGDNLQTGHRVTIREGSKIGSNVRIGTQSDIQGDCQIGDYVNMHSNVFIAQKSVIKSYAWLFPYVILTDDPNPPSENLQGVTIEEYAVIAAGSIILPGKQIGRDALVGAGSVVTKNVKSEMVVIGNPAKEVCNIRDIKDKSTGDDVYPWRYHFSRGMPWNGMSFEEWEGTASDHRR